MGNCLVTKLKEVVNNDNLPYLGYITTEVKESDTANESSLFFLIKKTPLIKEENINTILINSKFFFDHCKNSIYWCIFMFFRKDHF